MSARDSRSGSLADYLNILSGTSQNVVGIAVAAAATFTAQVLVSRALGRTGFGIVTVTTMAAFVASFLTRAGTDMAVLRDVAVEVGEGRYERIRTPVARGAQISFAVSAVAAVGIVAAAGTVRDALGIDAERGRWTVEAAAAGLPFLALANVWLSATRGLKIMRYTLYVFWAGQPVVWIALMVAGWQVSESEWMSVAAYSASWACAAVAAYLFWRSESRSWPAAPLMPGDMGRLFRYAGPRAPAALFSQLLFWTDLFVVTHYVAPVDVGVYSAALRAGQVLVLFLTSVSLMFSPFVADLHNRGERERLDRLFKALTRWTLAATLPAFVVIAIAPAEVLRVFGAEFSGGRTALLVLLAGQFVNVATGSVGFVLIMVGRTGWDLVVYAASLALDVGLALALCPRYGIEGAAIANSVTFALSKWARLALVRRFVGIQPYDRHYARLALPTLASAAAVWAAHRALPGGRFGTLVLVAAAGLGSFAAVYLAAGLTPAERRGVAAVVAKLRRR